ncbi:MAG TPA: hypothetical protein DD641_02420 [Deltaproteobacteria bacterium]|nr:hypothetical protein [Deltaproteobacteria bacterium]
MLTQLEIMGRFMKTCFLILLFSIVVFILPSPVYSQGLTVVSRFVEGDIPLTVDLSIWQKVNPIVIPLSSQIVAHPMASLLPAGKSLVREITVRSINNGKVIAFLLEWEDATDNSSPEGIDTFRDAAALQFPVRTSARSEDTPYFAMGEKGRMVNIWQWRSDARVRGTPPVEDLMAEGFGTLTYQTSQDVRGIGLWLEGRWEVVLLRMMRTLDENDVEFENKGLFPIAFAVWNGANKERDGQKSISTWHSLRIE